MGIENPVPGSKHEDRTVSQTKFLDAVSSWAIGKDVRTSSLEHLLVVLQVELSSGDVVKEVAGPVFSQQHSWNSQEARAS